MSLFTGAFGLDINLIIVSYCLGFGLVPIGCQRHCEGGGGGSQ